MVYEIILFCLTWWLNRLIWECLRNLWMEIAFRVSISLIRSRSSKKSSSWLWIFDIQAKELELHKFSLHTWFKVVLLISQFEWRDIWNENQIHSQNNEKYDDSLLSNLWVRPMNVALTARDFSNMPGPRYECKSLDTGYLDPSTSILMLQTMPRDK